MVCIKTFLKSYKKYLIRAAIMWAVCLVLLVLIYMLILGPQTNSRRNLEDRLAEKKQEYEMAQIAAREQTKIRLNREIEDLRRTLENFVVDSEDSANLTFDIGRIANEQDVASFSIKNKAKKGVSDIPDCECISESHIDIGFIAGFDQFATFINTLERHQPVLFINEFSIAQANKDESAYQVTLDVAAFVKKQQDKELAGQSSVQMIDQEI